MKYSLSEIFYLSICKIRTFFVVPSARLVRFPIDIRGKRNIDFGKKLTTGKYNRIESFPQFNANGKLIFGDNVQIGDFCHIASLNEVHIGSNVLMASKVFITDIVHGSYIGNTNDSFPAEFPVNRHLSSKPVSIGDNVWIGENVAVMPGVTIGNGCVIGANSVVTKSIPTNCIAVGNPAKVIKKYNEETKCWEKIDLEVLC